MIEAIVIVVAALLCMGVWRDCDKDEIKLSSFLTPRAHRPGDGPHEPSNAHRPKPVKLSLGRATAPL